MENVKPPREYGSRRDFEIDASNATGELFAALAKAQAEAVTVKKGKFNKEISKNYASGEDMIRGTREPLNSNGLLLIQTSNVVRHTDVNQGDIGKQFLSHVVKADWLLAHKSGGFIQGKASIPAIAGRMRPQDKSHAADETYMTGFIRRNLLNIDRDESPEDVDARYEEVQAGKQREHSESANRAEEIRSAPEPIKHTPARIEAWNDMQDLYVRLEEAAGRTKTVIPGLEDLCKDELKEQHTGMDMLDVPRIEYVCGQMNIRLEQMGAK